MLRGSLHWPRSMQDLSGQCTAAGRCGGDGSGVGCEEQAGSEGACERCSRRVWLQVQDGVFPAMRGCSYPRASPLCVLQVSPAYAGVSLQERRTPVANCYRGSLLRTPHLRQPDFPVPSAGLAQRPAVWPPPAGVRVPGKRCAAMLFATSASFYIGNQCWSCHCRSPE